MLLRKFSWLYRCADWRCRDFFAAENIKDIKSFRAKKNGFNISGNYSGGFLIANCAGKKCTAPCKVWVRSSYSLPRPWSNVKVPHLACKVWVRSSYSLVVCLERDLCLSYTLHTLTFSMRTNSVLTPCKQGAVHFSPRPYAQYRWATRLQARCGTLSCNHLSSYPNC